MEDVKKEQLNVEAQAPIEEVKTTENLQETPKVEEKQVEQLQPTVELVPEGKVENLTSKETVEENKPVEQLEKQVEQPVEQLEKPVEEVKEQLSKDIQKTKEELAVIQEVRDELVALYAQNRELEAKREALSKELEALKQENKQNVERLSRYVVAEQEMLAKQRISRLEKLSEKFKILGQEKTVESLSSKDDQTISEFEKIVEAALEKANERTVLPDVTMPSQARPVEALSKEEPKKVEKLNKPRHETSEEFFARMCNQLTNEQLSSYKKNNKVLTL